VIPKHCVNYVVSILGFALCNDNQLAKRQSSVNNTSSQREIVVWLRGTRFLRWPSTRNSPRPVPVLIRGPLPLLMTHQHAENENGVKRATCLPTRWMLMVCCSSSYSVIDSDLALLCRPRLFSCFSAYILDPRASSRPQPSPSRFQIT
jgi:hypothetical protein